MPLKSALLRNFGDCCFAVTLLKVAFMVIRGDQNRIAVNQKKPGETCITSALSAFTVFF